MVDIVTFDQYAAGGAAEQLNAAAGALKGSQGSVFATSQTGITAGTTRTQAGAYALSSQYSRVDTTTAHSATTLLGDGVALPLSTSLAGSFFVLRNNTTNYIQVYGTSSDTVNGIAGSSGVAQLPLTTEVYICSAANTWHRVGQGTSRMAAFTTNSATTDVTLDAANISGGRASVDLALTGALSGGAAVTLPTVAALLLTMDGPTVGSTYRLRITNNNGGQTWTVTTNTGWTLTGTMTVATNTWREFAVKITSTSAATLQNVAVGTFS